MSWPRPRPTSKAWAWKCTPSPTTCKILTQIPALVDDVLAQLGTIDILVNNAGATWAKRPKTIPMPRGTR